MNGWKGLRVLVTSYGHPHYNEVLTIVGRFTSDGNEVLRAQLPSGQQTSVREGEFKVVKNQD